MTVHLAVCEQVRDEEDDSQSFNSVQIPPQRDTLPFW